MLNLKAPSQSTVCNTPLKKYFYLIVINPTKFCTMLLLVGMITSVSISCTNPVVETEQKAVEGGEKVIEKARDVQRTIDATGQQTVDQEKRMESQP